MYLAPIFTTATTVAASTKHSNAEWPLEEYQERRIMNALSHTSSPTALYSSEGEDEPESPSYFSDRAIFQLNAQVRRQSLSNSLRCSICQRRFHSQGNLSNHRQLYH